MGYMRHHAIVVTTWQDKLITEAHQKACEIFGNNQVTPVIGPTIINGFYSFFVGPDGSKEGWGESDLGDASRSSFIKWINDQADKDDGSNSLKYAELYYGDEQRKSEITAHN